MQKQHSQSNEFTQFLFTILAIPTAIVLIVYYGSSYEPVLTVLERLMPKKVAFILLFQSVGLPVTKGIVGLLLIWGVQINWKDTPSNNNKSISVAGFFMYLPIVTGVAVLPIFTLEKSSTYFWRAEAIGWVLLFVCLLLILVFSSKTSFSEKGIYRLKLQKGGYWNIVNPFRGILISGNAGSGKTASIIKPLLKQSLSQNHSVFCYDYKYPDLSGSLYKIMKDQQQTTQFWSINFEDLERSHRINPFAAHYLKDTETIAELIEIIGQNLFPQREQGSFWYSSFLNYFTAIVCFLKSYENGKYCTLPFAVSIALHGDIKEVITMLWQDQTARDRIAALKIAVEKTADGQTAGILGTAFTYLNKLNSPSIFWVLSKNETPLILNYDPDFENKEINQCNKVLCIGNSSEKENSLRPILALITQSVMRLNNRSARGEKEVKGRIPLLLAIDEFPTLRLNNAERIPAVGRSRKIITCFAFQDLSQLQEQYGLQSARTIIANLATQFWGMASGLDTASYINKLFGKRMVKKVSRSKGRSQNHYHIPLLSTEHQRNNSRSENRSTNMSDQWEDALPIHEVAEMEVGEFAALLPYNSPVHQRKRLVYEKEETAEIPIVTEVTDVDGYYEQIRAEAQEIILKYLDRVEEVFVEKGRVGESRGVRK